MTAAPRCIAIFSAHHLPHIGGVEKYTHNLANELARHGHRIIIVTSAFKSSPSKEQIGEGVEVVRLPVFNTLAGRFPITRHNAEYACLIRYLKNQSIDHIVINARFYRQTFEGVALAKHYNITPLIIDHGSAHLTLGSKLLDPLVETAEHALTAKLKKTPAHYYTVSSAGKEWITHFGIKAKGILSNSIDAKKFCASASDDNYRALCNLSAEDFVIAFTGRLIPEKGIKDLMGAACLTKQNPHIHYLIAGSGPLEEYVTKSGLKNVHFLGRLTPEQVASLLLESNVLCLPSRSEGFSTSLLEAAATNTTPLTTYVGGVKELMPSSDYGIILPDTKPDTIAQSILKLEEDRELCANLANNLHEHVIRNFSWENTARALETALDIGATSE